MDSSGSWIRRDDLLDYVARCGQRVSRAQLRRWHKADIVPRPTVRHLGRGKGTESWYGHEAADLVVALASLRPYARTLPDLAWLTWWHGHAVPPGIIRARLEGEAGNFSAVVRGLRSGETLSKRALSWVDQAEKARLHPALARARRRVGKARASTLVRVMLELLTGTFHGFEEDVVSGRKEDQEILIAGLGLRRAQTDAAAGGQPWLPKDIEEEVGEVGQLMRAADLPDLVAAISDEEIVAARDGFQRFVRVFTAMQGIASAIFGQGAFGFAEFARQLREATDADDQVLMLLLWLVVRSSLGDLIEAWLDAVEPSASVVTDSQKLTYVAKEVTAVGAVWSPQHQRRALRLPAEQHRLDEDLARVSAAYSREITEALARWEQLHAMVSWGISGTVSTLCVP